MFQYVGIKIEFSERNAEFSAMVDGKMIRGTSLAGIKKKIDAYKETKAGSFVGLVRQHYGEKLKRVSIVGIANSKKAKWSFQKGDKWKDINGNEHGIVYKDTPETEALYIAAQALDARQAKERDALRDKHDELSCAAWEAIPKHEFPVMETGTAAKIEVQDK